MITNLHRPSRWERGQSLVELAFGSIVLILIFGGMIDVGRAFLSLVALENAAGEGALYGAIHPECLTRITADTTDDPTNAAVCSGSESVQGRVYNESNSVATFDTTNTTIQAEIENGAAITAGSIFRVRVVYTFTPWTPVGKLFWGSTGQIEATARQQVMSPPPPGYKY